MQSLFRKISPILLLAAAPAAAQKVPFTIGTPFNEPFVYGTRPAFRGFSADDRTVFFAWNDSAYSATSLYRTDLVKPAVTKAEAQEDFSANLSPDGKWRLTYKDGDIWLTDLVSRSTRRIVKTPAHESGAQFSSDGRRIAYTSEGGVWVLDHLTGAIVQVTRREGDEPAWQTAAWAAGDRALVLTRAETSAQKDLFFPEYAGRFVEPGRSSRGLTKTSVWLAWIDSTRPRKLFEGEVWIRSLSGSPDGRSVLADMLSPDMKLRDIFRWDVNGGAAVPVFHDSTAGWINFSYAVSAFAPRADRYAFSSEQDGWNHLYLVEKGGAPRQLTRGSWEINWWRWVDDQNIVYLANTADPGEYHLYLLDTQKNFITQLTKEEAYRSEPALSPNRTRVVYTRAFWNQPGELYALDLKERKEVRLTKSVPDGFQRFNWLRPEYVRFTGRDNRTQLSMTVLKPDSLAPGEKRPVAVFVHGAGSLQNVYKGWSDSYYREYVFHQYLVQQGYVVIEVDYRHSLGYGRVFREDVTGRLGRFELEDLEDGLRELDRRGYADLSRVGVYGGSYGGFMALHAVTHSPDYFHAGAALRAVTNWENYYHANPWYTLPRMGRPERDRDAYVWSSPVHHVARLTRPVLILHGLIDNNVGFQDAVQYVEKLIQLRKQPFDMMMYPTERHSFTDADAWFDEYDRIFRFFEEHVKGRRTGAGK